MRIASYLTKAGAERYARDLAAVFHGRFLAWHAMLTGEAKLAI